MSKISELPRLTEADIAGAELAPVTKGGATYAAPIDILGGAAARQYALGDNNTNLFDRDDADRHDGFALDAAGKLTANALFYVTHYMDVEGLAEMTRDPTAADKVFSFYSAAKESAWMVNVQAPAASTSLAVPAGAKYARASLRIAESPPETLVFVAGNVPREGWVAFVGETILRQRVKDQAGGFAGVGDDGLIDTALVDTRSSRQLFDADAAKLGYALAGGLGTTAANPDFFTTDFIPVRAGETYSHSIPAAGKFYSFYNSADSADFVIQLTSTGSFVAPITGFVRGSHRYADHSTDDYQLVEGASLPAVKQPYIGKVVECPANKGQPFGYAGLDENGMVPAAQLPAAAIGNLLGGKTLAGLGDSLTEGFIPRNAPGYPGFLQSWLPLAGDLLGASTVLNHGISGSTLAYHATRNPMSRRFADISDDADVINVFGGANDVRNGIVLGALGDDTDATFYGALDVIAKGLLQKYRYDQGETLGAEKLIVFWTPMRMFDANEPDYLNALLPSFRQAVLDVAQVYAIPVFDAYNASGLTPELFRTLQGTETGYTDLYNPFVPDGTHPTQEGQLIMAKAYASFLRSVLA